MLFAAQGSPANELGRASEPVVLTGVDVPALSGADPTALSPAHESPGRRPVLRLDAASGILLPSLS
jgi:hypothetical protein